MALVQTLLSPVVASPEREACPSATAAEGEDEAAAGKKKPIEFDTKSFFAVNPELMDDTSVWTYRDLQRLCKEIGVNAAGKRKVLVDRIREWHHENDDAIQEDPERWPERGSNLSLLPVNIKEAHQRTVSLSFPESDGVDHASADEAIISPLVLRPTKSSNGTPRSLMKAGRKRSPSYMASQGKQAAAAQRRRIESVEDTSPSDDGRAGGTKARASGGIQFSPFNRVQVIPAKEEYTEYEDDEERRQLEF